MAYEKELNIYVNTSMVMMGSMLMMFSGIAEKLGKAFSGDMGADEKVSKAMDQFAGEVIDDLQGNLKDLRSKLEGVKNDHPKVYDRVFNRPSMQKLVAVEAQNGPPAGYKSLTESLTKEEIMQYVFHWSISEESGESDSPVVTYLGAVLDQLKALHAEFEEDSEIEQLLA